MISWAAGFCIWSSERLIAERFIKSQVASMLPVGSTSEGPCALHSPAARVYGGLCAQEAAPRSPCFGHDECVQKAKSWSFGMARTPLGTFLCSCGDIP